MHTGLVRITSALVDPALLDLPWSVPLEEWPASHLVALPQGIAYFSSEDFYHMGQVSFIRQASDPTWNYYEAIYGITYPAESPNPYP